MVKIEDKYIERAWRNYSQPGALSALHGFVKNKGIKDIREAEKSLSKIAAYSLHRPQRKKFKRRPLILRGPRHTFCADLADFRSISRSNSGYAWILVVLDCFTKELFCAPLKKKDSDNTLAGFKAIFKASKKPPQFMQTDQGKEFVGTKLKTFYKQNNIHHYVTFSKLKAFLCERIIKTLKERIYKYMTLNNTKRWVDVLPQIVKAYNNTPHSSHKFKPSEVTKKVADEAFVNQYKRLLDSTIPKTPAKFKVGDLVRISKNRVTFEKGYTASFSEEIFKIKEVRFEATVYIYVLEDLQGEQVQSTFYQEELSLAG